MRLRYTCILVVIITILSACSSNTEVLEPNRLEPSPREVNSSDYRLLTLYNFVIIRLDAIRAIKFIKYFRQVRGIKAISSISVRTSERKYSIETVLGLDQIEEEIWYTLRDVGVDPSEFRLEMSGQNIKLENLR
jgi:hypothetical protein